MKQYLSFGGGVNSTALLLLLTDRGKEFETVFVNHGGDYPATYDYVDYLRNEGYKITEIIPNCRGYNSLYTYCFAHKIIPTVHFRWCTVEFKVKPYLDYISQMCPVYHSSALMLMKRNELSEVKLVKLDMQLNVRLKTASHYLMQE